MNSFTLDNAFETWQKDQEIPLQATNSAAFRAGWTAALRLWLAAVDRGPNAAASFTLQTHQWIGAIK